MGEIAEMMLEGYLCSQCGVFLSEEPTGYATLCESCQEDDDSAEDDDHEAR